MAVNEAASGGAWSTVQIDGKWYRLGRFTAVSSALVLASAMALELLLVGAGGTGGTGGSRGGGGGGGWVRVDTVQVQPGSYTIEVGVASSATASTIGNPSRAFGLIAPGGGAGGPSAGVGGDGGNGGGGGGSGGAAVPNLAGGLGNPGFPGGRGHGGTIAQRASGGGGGANGLGGGGQLGIGGTAGPGRSINFDGTQRVYGAGGRGSGPALPAVPDGATNPGAGGDGGSSSFGAAQNGIVMVRYEITDPFLPADHPGATFWSETIDGVPYKGMIIPASAGLASLKPMIPVGVEYLLVAGGGGAPYYQAANTGGGGAGGILRGTTTLSAGTVYPIAVGVAGTQSATNTVAATSGSDTTAFTLSAVGGGKGGSPRTISLRLGGPGGSGGGTVQGQGPGGSGTPGQGYDGGTGPSNNPGAGGGAGGVGVPYTPGLGLLINFHGVPVWYSVGGQSGGASALPEWGGPGSGANGGPTNGNTGHTPGSGTDGVVEVRWRAGAAPEVVPAAGGAALILGGGGRGQVSIPTRGQVTASLSARGRFDLRILVSAAALAAIRAAGVAGLRVPARGGAVLHAEAVGQLGLSIAAKGAAALALDAAGFSGLRIAAFGSAKAQLLASGSATVIDAPITIRGRIATVGQSRSVTDGLAGLRTTAGNDGRRSTRET